MSERISSRRFVARVRAFLEEDWSGQAGRLFRRGISTISEVNEEYLRLGEKAEEAPDLAWRAVQGLAGEKHAKAIANYARAENEKIDLALKQRVLDDKVRQEKAIADKLESEAALAKLNELKARAELNKILYDIRMAVTVDESGVIRVHRGQSLPLDFAEEIFTLPEKRELGLVVDIRLLETFESAQFHLGVITFTKWLCGVGDRVERDQPIYEISSESVDAEVPSPANGIVTAIYAQEGDVVQLETTLGLIQKMELS